MPLCTFIYSFKAYSSVNCTGSQQGFSQATEFKPYPRQNSNTNKCTKHLKKLYFRYCPYTKIGQHTSGSKTTLHPVLQVHAGSRVSVIRQMTRTTGSLTCVGDHSDACTQELGTPTMSQHIFDLKKIFFILLLTGFESRVFGSQVQHYHLSHPNTPYYSCCHSPYTQGPNSRSVLYSCHI